MSKGISQYSLPERVAYFRKQREMTQAQLADKAGVSQSTIAQIESGDKDPSIETLKKIAKAFDTHIAILFAAEDVFVFDMTKLRKKYDHVDKLNPTLYFALGKIVSYAKDIGFTK